MGNGDVAGTTEGRVFTVPLCTSVTALGGVHTGTALRGIPAGN
jgi:hypothetical protein